MCSDHMINSCQILYYIQIKHYNVCTEFSNPSPVQITFIWLWLGCNVQTEKSHDNITMVMHNHLHIIIIIISSNYPSHLAFATSKKVCTILLFIMQQHFNDPFICSYIYSQAMKVIMLSLIGI